MTDSPSGRHASRANRATPGIGPRTAPARRAPSIRASVAAAVAVPAAVWAATHPVAALAALALLVVAATVAAGVRRHGGRLRPRRPASAGAD